MFETTTDADGSYAFFDLAPGVYSIMETHPSPLVDGPDILGSLGGVQQENDLFEGDCP